MQKQLLPLQKSDCQLSKIDKANHPCWMSVTDEVFLNVDLIKEHSYKPVYSVHTQTLTHDLVTCKYTCTHTVSDMGRNPAPVWPHHAAAGWQQGKIPLLIWQCSSSLKAYHQKAILTFRMPAGYGMQHWRLTSNSSTTWSLMGASDAGRDPGTTVPSFAAAKIASENYHLVKLAGPYQTLPPWLQQGLHLHQGPRRAQRDHAISINCWHII